MSDAVVNATAWADIHMKLVACPRCGGGNEKAVGDLKRTSLKIALGGVGAIILAVPVGALATVLDGRIMIFSILVGLVGIVFAVIGALWPSMAIGNARGAVTFLDHPPPPIGVACMHHRASA